MGEEVNPFTSEACNATDAITNDKAEFMFGRARLAFFTELQGVHWVARWQRIKDRGDLLMLSIWQPAGAFLGQS